MKKIKRNILLNPGPATTTDTVKLAQLVPDICPREKEFENLMGSIIKDLVKIANGGKSYAAILFAGSGTGGIEAMVSSVIAPGKKFLVLNNGAYGKRMADIARAYKIPVKELQFNWAEPIDLGRVEKELKKDKKIKYLGFIHHETTTGQLNPLRKLDKLGKKYGCLNIIDAVSSFAGIPIDVKKDGVDFMASTSNKSIQGMAGVVFVIAKKSRLEKIKDYPRRNLYFSLYDQYRYSVEKYQMRFTPPVQTIYALRQAIDEFFGEGAQNRFKRYKKSWLTLYQGLKKLGFKFLIPEENQSHILTTVFEPAKSKFDFNRLHDLLYEKGFTIYPGKLDDERKTFRIANMGAINYRDIQKFLVELQRVLGKVKVKGTDL